MAASQNREHAAASGVGRPFALILLINSMAKRAICDLNSPLELKAYQEISTKAETVQLDDEAGNPIIK